jgi:hypothetical protein
MHGCRRFGYGDIAIRHPALFIGQNKKNIQAAVDRMSVTESTRIMSGVYRVFALG